MAFETYGLSVDDPLANEEDSELIIRTFMLYFLLPSTQSMKSDGARLRRLLPKAHLTYMGWNDTMIWVDDLKEAIKYEDRMERNPFVKRSGDYLDFPSLVRLAERVTNDIGKLQDIECKDLKHALMDLEDSGRRDGRVALGSFYGPALANMDTFFKESPEFLRHLGALDESDPNMPSVIVPNMVYARSNCLAASGVFHSLCCINDCDALMESLELRIASPAASPGLVAELVADLPSDTVAAPRNLSDSLRRKLYLIADQHGGRVPLHGRLFSQWMHHAFPYECPQPFGSGDLEAPMTGREWREIRKMDPQAPRGVMQTYAYQLKNTTSHGGAQDELNEAKMQWVEEEELLSEFALQKPLELKTMLRSVLCVLALLGLVWSLGSELLDFMRTAACLRGEGVKGSVSRGEPCSVMSYCI
jgi:hypothetical protein